MTYEALKQDCEYLSEKISLLDTLLKTQKELIYRLEVENSELKAKANEKQIYHRANQ